MIEVRQHHILDEKMFTVNGPTHFTNDGKIIKVWLNKRRSDTDQWAFDASKDGDPITTHYFNGFTSILHAASSFLLGVELQEGAMFDELINQGVRDCEVVTVKRARFRIEYEMPNAGMMGAWRKPTFIRGDGWYYNPDREYVYYYPNHR